MKLSKSLEDKLDDKAKATIAPYLEKIDKILIEDGQNPDNFFLDDKPVEGTKN